MSTLETIPNELGLEEAFEQKGGSEWLASDAIDPRKLTEIMMAHHARLIALTAIQVPGEEDIVIDYHWDLEDKLLTFEIPVVDKTMASIVDLCEGADWHEREIHEQYEINFTGRDYEPLLLRQGFKTGVNLREED